MDERIDGWADGLTGSYDIPFFQRLLHSHMMLATHDAVCHNHYRLLSPFLFIPLPSSSPSPLSKPFTLTDDAHALDTIQQTPLPPHPPLQL